MIVQDAEIPPSRDVTVIVTVPAFKAVTTPLDTVAIVASLVVQVTALFVALFGEIVAVKVTVGVTNLSIDREVSFNVTSVT